MKQWLLHFHKSIHLAPWNEEIRQNKQLKAIKQKQKQVREETWERENGEGLM